MRELHYGSSVLITSFDVCQEIFNYSLALLAAKTQAVVEVPVVVRGFAATSNVLLGIPVPLHCEPSSEGELDLDDAGFIARVRSETAALQRFGARLRDATPVHQVAFDYDRDFAEV